MLANSSRAFQGLGVEKHCVNTIAAWQFQAISSSFQLPYQLYSSSEDCARKQFKPSKDAANLQVCNEKIFFWFQIFC